MKAELKLDMVEFLVDDNLHNRFHTRQYREIATAIEATLQSATAEPVGEGRAWGIVAFYETILAALEEENGMDLRKEFPGFDWESIDYLKSLPRKFDLHPQAPERDDPLNDGLGDIRCLCDWQCPETGELASDYPAVLNPKCPVPHTIPQALSEPEQGGVETVSAVLFILERDGKILMERCPKKGKLFGAEWFIPGGRIESGESFEQTLVREMKEELGCTPLKVKWLGLVDRTPENTDTFLMKVAVVEEWEGDVPNHNLSQERTPLEWMSKQEVATSPVSGIRAAIVTAFATPSSDSERGRRAMDELRKLVSEGRPW